MSYQVLARKWRPGKFEELVGQEHVVAALTSALNNDRLHHAYLFTGTRGVGKTTLARILAKSLNCETAQGASPCGTCHTCSDIDQGRYVDLLEIDAASRTKVEDTRELLDNVQYRPSRGRFKVYLIDEVHMLSKHSFNALLKTLEEPPEHVKFLLATTDPQKLPVTILSRCIQFNLKALSREQIGQQLQHILTAEAIDADSEAIAQLARAAQGSMRDGLSLTDQAIAQGNGRIDNATVVAMLGLMDKHQVLKLVKALLGQKTESVFTQVEELAQQGADFSQLLHEITSLLHQIALTQFVPQACKLETIAAKAVYQLAKAVTPEHIQLLYQIAIQGQKDLPYADQARTGFEMTLLRMLAFSPKVDTGGEISHPGGAPAQQMAKQADVLTTEQQSERQENAEGPSGQEVPVSDASKQQGQQREPLQLAQAEVRESQQDDSMERVSAPPPSAGVEAEGDATTGAPGALQAENPPFAPAPDFDAEQEARMAALEAEQDMLINQASQLGGVISLPPAPETVNTEDLLALRRSLRAAPESTPGNSDGSKEAPAPVKKPEAANQGPLLEADDGHEAEAVPQHSDAADDNSAAAHAEAPGTAEPDRQQTGHQQEVGLAVGRDELGDDVSTDLPPWHNEEDISHAPAAEMQAGEVANTDNPFAQYRQRTPVEDEVPSVQFDATAQPEQSLQCTLSMTPVLDNGDKLIKAPQLDSWSEIIEKSQITALTKQLALHSSCHIEGDKVSLLLLDTKAHLLTDIARQQLKEALESVLARPITLDIALGQPENTPYGIQKKINAVRLDYARQQLDNDDAVALLKQTFDAVLVPESVKAN